MYGIGITRNGNDCVRYDAVIPIKQRNRMLLELDSFCQYGVGYDYIFGHRVLHLLGDIYRIRDNIPHLILLLSLVCFLIYHDFRTRNPSYVHLHRPCLHSCQMARAYILASAACLYHQSTPSLVKGSFHLTA